MADGEPTIITGARAAGLLLGTLLLLAFALPAAADEPRLPAATRVERLLRAMSADEKMRLIFGVFASSYGDYQPPPDARLGSAGYVPGIPRLGIPPQWQTDAGLGVATQRGVPPRERTSLPSGLATAASWNLALARQGGAMIGKEARDSGFNVMLAGGVNLARDPRNGRNFEYAGEDPLLAGSIVGAEIRGIQSNHIISTVKHFAVNDQETGRLLLSAELPEDQARQSDLLAFELAIEQGAPLAVMCAYNRYGGVYACENDFLLTRVLKQDWHFPGYVMSDWGAVHSTVAAAMAGLDQESGFPFDQQPYFGPELVGKALAESRLSPARLDDMARRILTALIASGAMDDRMTVAPIDRSADLAIAQADAEESLVLLRNRGDLLPLSPGVRRVAVIGSHADKGVLAGGGSSTVMPIGGSAVLGEGPAQFPGPIIWHPAPPLAAISRRLKDGDLRYDDGTDIARAAALAGTADLVLLFAHQWTGESQDASLSLDDGQDALIEAVAAANRNLVVVLETGGPVQMPWLDRVPAVLEAWYPGSGGGEAIARVLFGEVDASGRLPISFPQSPAQLPRPTLDGLDQPSGQPFSVIYGEGAAVGYKWFDRTNQTPLFPFGFGLSYSRFRFDALSARWDRGRLRLRFNVTNRGSRPGTAVPQLYAGPQRGNWEAPRRLVGWRKLALAPGATKTLSVTVDPRLLARFDSGAHRWIVDGGRYWVQLGANDGAFSQSVLVALPERRWAADQGSGIRRGGR